MKRFILFFICIVIALETSAQAVTKNGQITETSTNFVDKNGKTGDVPILQKNGRVFVIATLSTTEISSITSTTAKSGANITDDGGTTVTARGVCWSTSTNPTIADSKTTDGTGTGVFTSSIAELIPLTTYYVRAFATNSIGPAYGNELSFTTTALAIGESYQGGIIAYILQVGDPGYDANHTQGLIATPTDQSGGIAWWNGSNITTGATATALGTGNANTNAIIAAQGAGSYAAKLCADLDLGGYSDWYLPSKDELYKLYLNKVAIGNFSNQGVIRYWSSSEYNNSAAWAIYFLIGSNDLYGKLVYSNRVRAIRSF